jgi:hypothetical protein
MDILAAFLIASFVALLLAAAVTFGFALMTVCLIIAMTTTVLVLLREAWRRWRFLHNARNAPPPRVIEGDYKDISPMEDRHE